MTKVSTMALSLKDPTLLKDKAYIDGAWVGADGGGSFAVKNPASGEKIIDLPDQGAAETKRAIEAANAALPGWRATESPKPAPARGCGTRCAHLPPPFRATPQTPLHRDAPRASPQSKRAGQRNRPET